MTAVLLDPDNAREHSNANILAIARSLKDFGQLKPIVVNRHNNQIEAGNGTYLAAQTLGWTHIAALKVEHDPKAQRGFSIADNRTNDLSEFNKLRLEKLMVDVREESPDLYAELLLAELSLPAAEPASSSTKTPPAAEKLNTYQIVVQCDDAMDRRRLMRSLREKGRRCRALTWEGQVDMPGHESDEPSQEEGAQPTL